MSEDLVAERARLVARIAEIDAILGTRPSSPAPAAAGARWVLLSSAGLLGRWESAGPLPAKGGRTTHDVIISAVNCDDEYGVITNLGRIYRMSASALPEVPVTDQAPNLQGAILASNAVGLAPFERVIALTTLTARTFGWALGTRNGVVKRTNPEMPRGQDSWEIIRLEGDDEVVGAVELPNDHPHLVFITNDAQLLHYPATAVRPQGRAGGGMVGIKLDPVQEAIFFGAASVAEAVVVTNAGRKSNFSSDAPGSVKVTPLSAFPEKGRATGGVRAHRFLKGEDTLLLAWVGNPPAIAATKTGSPSNLPPADPKRDGAGVKGTLRLAAIGSRALG
ncbi:MAG: hypothetical protein LBR58_08495 [Propionibacteriaceae bacterium]|nr:hypothetical protein [Propionibacteriaceae bacterium]